MLVFSAVVLLLIAGASGKSSIDIYSLHIRSDIQLRFATTLITSRVANLANRSNEAVFKVILPEEAFISDFTMEIDGVVYNGVVDEKEAAEKQFQRAKKKGQSTGLVSKMPRESKSFKIQVNVAAFSKVTFNLTYQELLKRVLGVYQHKVFINPGQPVRDLKVRVAIQESRDITRLFVPRIQTNGDSYRRSSVENGSSIAVITRPTPNSAYITYSPTVDQQQATSKRGLAGHFIMEYDIERSLDAGDLLVVNGYFVHFLAPAVHEPINNNVLFVLDMSGSMSGSKLDQLKVALVNILDDLKRGDRFNILEFTGSTKLYKPEMIHVNTETIANTKQHVNGLRATGSTNVNSALLEGLRLLKSTGGENSPLLVFLTDGLPSSGVTDLKDILSNVQNENQGVVPIFSLAFGKDADWNLVKIVAAQNDGFGRKIYEDSAASLQISGFYDEIAVTLLNNIDIVYLNDTVDMASLTKSNFKNFFNGSEMVVAGKLDDPDSKSIDVEIIGDSAKGNLVLSKSSDGVDFNDVTGLMEISDIEEITEKLWAYLTIKELLKNTDTEFNETIRENNKATILEMSFKYGFVTPLTSMVVTKAEYDPIDVPKTPKPPRRGSGGGGGGGGGGGYGGGGGGDPHYMIRIRGIEHPLCFDVRSEAAEYQNLITDPVNGVTINTHIIQAMTVDKNGEKKTFIGQMSIQWPNHVIVVTPNAIFIDQKVFDWVADFSAQCGTSRVSILNGKSTLSIRLEFGPEILIKRTLHREKRSKKVDYLNVYIKEEDCFSKRTTGLIGQFVNGHKHIVMKKQQAQNGGKLMAKFQVKERPSNTSMVTAPKSVRHVFRGNLINRSEVVDQGSEPCWMIHKKYEEILLGNRTHYITDEFIQRQV